MVANCTGIIDGREKFCCPKPGLGKNHFRVTKTCSRRCDGGPLIIPLDEIVSPEGRPDALQTSGLAPSLAVSEIE